MSQCPQVTARSRGKGSRSHICRHPGRQTSDTAHLVADQIRLAGLHVVPEGIRALEVGAVLDGARWGDPVTEQAVAADLDHGAGDLAADVEADEGVVVDAENAEVDDGACLVVNVGFRLGEGLEVAGVGVADDVRRGGTAGVVGIVCCVLYIVSIPDHCLLLGILTNLDAQCTRNFPGGC